MKTEQKYLHDLHAEHREFESILNFAKDEIKVFEHRLEEIVSSNTSEEVLAPLEHFQNSFIRQKEVIDELFSEIRHSEHKITELAKANNVATEHRKTDDHTALSDKMNTFNKLFAELKVEFTTYTQKVF
jgi:hypothetical protein